MQSNDRNNETYKPLTGLIYLFNLMVGTGALTMPAAFANAGWLASAIIVVILCFVSYITTTFVIESMSLANAVLKVDRRRDSRKVRRPPVPTDRQYEVPSPTDNSESIDSCTEKVPLLDQISDTEETDEDEDTLLFEITEKVELGQMADLFFTRVGVKLFYVTIAVYLFGDLAIYGAAISKSLRDVTCTYEHQICNQTLELTDQCWPGIQSINRTNAYRIYLALTLVCVGPFAFFNVQKTKYLQILTTLLRWIAFISMTIIAMIALFAGKANGKPSAVSVVGIPNLFGVCVYSFMCHHSLPALVTPIRSKNRLFSLILMDYILILMFYSLLSFTGIYAFRTLQDIYTLNFQVQNCDTSAESPISPVPFLDYFLPLFPVFTLSTNFPIIAITLQNNLKTLFTTTEALENSPFFTKRLLYPLLAIIPPLVVSFATEDLEILVGIVGSYAGACIQYVFPALLVYYSRKRLISLYPTLDSTHISLKSPFGHKIWILLVLIWSVICVILVTTDHIIQFTK